MKNTQGEPAPRAAGYAFLINRYGIDVIPNWHRSMVGASGIRKVVSTTDSVEETYPDGYWPGDNPGNHLEFALKYDGTNLAILADLFRVMPTDAILDYVRSRPTGKYARRLWFLYEFLTGATLPLEDLDRGNYIDLLDPGTCFSTATPRQVRRQRIRDNLLGDARFCPTVRRTSTLRAFEDFDLPERCRKLVANYPAHLLRRAMSYLYTRETKSSFEIEHIKPSSSRTERVMQLLNLAATEDFCEKARLIDLQNRIVDLRFVESDYRTSQNYVGETVDWQRERVYFVCPKPEDLSELMDGLVASHARMGEGQVSAVVHAAAVAYGFVFLHPFEDGNGRIHRFLIHNILARRGFTPAGLIFPVSAAMLKDPISYDASLESFSGPLLNLVDFFLDEDGRMTVQNDTETWYRFIDMTSQVEALFRFIEQTIDTELAEELVFLANYDRTREALRKIVDMPDRKIDLFMRSCLQNSRLSTRLRTTQFAFLTDDEISRMEEVIRSFNTTDSVKESFSSH